jgi:hypothetical protein
MLFIFASLIGNVQINPSNYNEFLLSLKTAFTVFAVLSGFGIIVSYLIGEKLDKLDNP